MLQSCKIFLRHNDGEGFLMISKRQFFVHFILEILIASFFIFLAVLLLPIRGWEFATIFCCVFATFSISNAIRMVQSYLAMRKFINETVNLLEKNASLFEIEDDDDASKE